MQREVIGHNESDFSYQRVIRSLVKVGWIGKLFLNKHNLVFFGDKVGCEIHLSSGRVSEGLSMVQTGLNSTDVESTIQLVSLVLNNV